MIRIKIFLSLICAIALSATASPPVTVAHRGAVNEAPENTAAAFSAAAERGAAAIECDLRLTADGVLVCHHDESTGRVWSEDLTVSESSYESLARLELSHGFRAAFPAHRGVRIPTFDMAVEAMGEARIFAEIKGGGRKAADTLHGRCQALGITERVTVLSYDREVAEYAHALGYECILLLNCKDSAELLATDLPAGMTPGVNKTALTCSALKELHRRGHRVFAYTARTEKEHRALSKMGVDGIIADK